MTAQPKIFFTKLKETLRKIEHDVNEVKKKMYDVPGNNEAASKKLLDFQDDVNTLKKEARELKQTLEPKLAHTSKFIQHFKDLLSETEVLVTKQESYLAQFGYKPLGKASVQNPVDEEEKQNYSSPIKDPSAVSENKANTPNLFEYGLMSRGSLPSDLNERKSSIEDLSPPKKFESSETYKILEKTKESTPTLLIELEKNEQEIFPMSGVTYVYTSPKTPTLEL